MVKIICSFHYGLYVLSSLPYQAVHFGSKYSQRCMVELKCILVLGIMFWPGCWFLVRKEKWYIFCSLGLLSTRDVISRVWSQTNWFQLLTVELMISLFPWREAGENWQNYFFSLRTVAESFIWFWIFVCFCIKEIDLFVCKRKLTCPLSLLLKSNSVVIFR